MSVTCDRCEQPIVGAIHEPHDPGCPGGDCQCLNEVCAGCCWNPDCNPEGGEVPV